MNQWYTIGKEFIVRFHLCSHLLRIPAKEVLCMKFPKLDKKSLTDGITIPHMVRVRQTFPDEYLTDPVDELQKQLSAHEGELAPAVKGQRIGITAGSRGVPYYKELLRLLCRQLQEWGASPFIFPAMGSHAGATAEGQKQHLAQFGICEEYLGVPVISTMETVQVDQLPDGMPVYCDKAAYEADGIILFNKIKPHTHFKAPHESGLLKMICIGVGKHRGASAFHSLGYDHFGENLERVSEAFLKKVRVFFSVGLTQSPSDHIGHLEVIPTPRLFEEDARLQQLARAEMPHLLLPRIDVLVIDEVGKEISGAGMDPNVTGRTERESQFAGFHKLAPDIEKIVLLDITEKAHGNATGAGVADIISYRFVNKIDFAMTYTNIITAKSFHMGAMPLYANSDKDAIEMAIAHSFLPDPSQAKVVRIKNTISLNELECSVACIPDIQKIPAMEVISDPYDWKFNEEDNLW